MSPLPVKLPGCGGANAKSIYHQYHSLSAAYSAEYGPRTAVMMQVGSFFELYGFCSKDDPGQIDPESSMYQCATLGDLVISKKSKASFNPWNTARDGGVWMAGCGLGQMEKYAGKFQDAGFTVVVVDQDIPGQNTTRTVSKVLSPGATMNDSDRIAPTVCVYLEPQCIGYAAIEVKTGKVTYGELVFPRPTACEDYDALEGVIAAYGPVEVILCDTSHDPVGSTREELIAFLGLSNVKTHFLLDSPGGLDRINRAGRQVYQAQALTEYFPSTPDDELSSIYIGQGNAAQALILLLDFVKAHDSTMVSELDHPAPNVQSHHLALANHSLRQLNIVADGRKRGKFESLMSMLKETVTPQGGRLFKRSITSPMVSVGELERVYSGTELLLGRREIVDGVRSELRSAVDDEFRLRKLICERGTCDDIVSLWQNANICLRILDKLEAEDCFYETVLLGVDRNRVREDAECITADLERCFNVSGTESDSLSEGFILGSDEVDEQTLRMKSIAHSVEILRQRLASLAGAEGPTQEDTFVRLHETPKQGSYLQTTSRRAKFIVSEVGKLGSDDVIVPLGDNSCMVNLSHLVHKGTGASTCVSSPCIENLLRKHDSEKNALSVVVREVFAKYVSDFVARSSSAVRRVSKFLALVDLSTCRAHIASKYNYVRPRCVDSKTAFVQARQLRHPLVEHLNTKETYVTNDVSLDSSSTGILLFGTNAVGKTCLVKSVGLAVVMAQAGLFVAAESFTFSPYERVCTRIVGQDNLFQGLSTFVAEMSEVRCIIRDANARTLVLGDELCSGTETSSALAITSVTLEHLERISASFIFATHLHELAEYECMKKIVRLRWCHMKVVYDGDKLVYDRKLSDGLGDRSYGLEVCKSLGFPDNFLRRAVDVRDKQSVSSAPSVLDRSTSRYSSSKLSGSPCELCGVRIGREIHHLLPQKSANSDNYIGSVHKNHPGNLACLCEECHDELHATDKELEYRITGTGRARLMEN